ncbi:MAG TPA: hypothetical protein VFA38_00615, partial [Nitrospirales bacterium]|nr:hypothetical protein [Nitrospirales bacterium]
MYKIKKKKPAQTERSPSLYDVIEDYTEFDPPGNVTVCAMTGEEDLAAHARILAESYDVPADDMTRLLTGGGLYLYPTEGGVITRGAFVCRIDEGKPKQTWVLDVAQLADAEQLRRSYGLSLEDAAVRVFYRTLAPQLRAWLDSRQDLRYIDFRKDWSRHFKRLCAMPDGRLVETGGLEEFADVHGISVQAARTLVQEGGTLEVGGEVIACQVVNGQPSIARFNARQYAKAKAIVADKGMHLLDALSEVAFNDPVMMRALRK